MGVVNKRTLTKTRRKLRDVDQVKADLSSPAHLARYTSTRAAEDLPGLGRHYCISCAKWFETPVALEGHRRGKPHKRRLKQLQGEPYSQKEAEAAVGIRTDNAGPKPVLLSTTLATEQVTVPASTTADTAMS